MPYISIATAGCDPMKTIWLIPYGSTYQTSDGEQGDYLCRRQEGPITF